MRDGRRSGELRVPTPWIRARLGEGRRSSDAEAGHVRTASRTPGSQRRSGSCARAATSREASSRSCAPTSSPGSPTTSPCSRASWATTTASSRPSRTPSSRARTSCSWASAARPRPGSPARWSALLDEVDPGRRRQGAQRGPVRADPARPPASSSRRRAMTTPIGWLPRDRRYAEKLATPDITIADLIGEVDPIKVAEGRYLADASTIHFGLIPRTNRGIFTHQRAARPRGAHPGRPAQHARGARRPGARPHPAAAARPVRGRERQPRGLHQPRPHHHAPQGPPRVARSGPTTRAPSSTSSPIMRQERTPLRRTTASTARGRARSSCSRSSPSCRTSRDARRRSASGRASACASASPTSRRCSPTPCGAPSAWARRPRPRAISDLRRPRRLDDRQARARVAERRGARGARGRPAAGARHPRRVRPARGHRRARRRSWMRSSRGSSSRPASRCPPATTCAGCARRPACRSAVGRLGVGESPAAVASGVEFLLEGLHLHRRLNKDRAATGGLYRG